MGVGIFPDYTNILAQLTAANNTYTVTADCVAMGYVGSTTGSGAYVKVDGITVQTAYVDRASNRFPVTIYIKNGRTISVTGVAGYTCDITVYGLTK